MTRFGLTQKALVNHLPLRNPLFAGESGDRPTESWRDPESLARNCRRTAASAESRGLARFLIFSFNDASLLIVPALFFIQRRNGEVAEWSKALPC